LSFLNKQKASSSRFDLNPMEVTVIVIFVIGYLLIALEHPVKVNKSATAIITGVLCWTVYAVMDSGSIEHIGEQLSHHLSGIAAILFFLMGAMTIVELVDAYHGFRIITDRITTKNPKTLLWVICWVTFFLSALLDNLTTSIVMVSLVRKLVPNKNMRLFFCGMIVIGANAGGAWSPIGDVTTTMLWIGGQISSLNIIKTLLLPSIVCMAIPLLYLQFTLKGELGHGQAGDKHGDNPQKTHIRGSGLMFFIGICGLISVPVFKTLTHLPPYLGMLLALGVLWVISEMINPDMDEAEKKPYTASHALTRIDVPSVLFFLGILLAVSCLESMEILSHFAAYLEKSLGDNRIIITLIGILSAIVDNVPLVAASMGMYSLETYHMDHMIWEYLAYCAGTGGSILIIGSAAGVAVMGMEKIDFIWYLKRISLLAALGYFAGAIVYLLIYPYLAVHPPVN
jgi:Na+/H+ antiporter NhaD/arsenite permease-like protein